MTARARASFEDAPIPRMLAASALVLPPVLLIAFEPDGTRHPLLHQLRSLVAVWLYTVLVVVVIHLATELAEVFFRARGSSHALRSEIVGVLGALATVVVLSIPTAPLLASVCPGIAGHEGDLVLRGALLGAVYAFVGLMFGRTQRAWLASRLGTERAQRAEAEARLAAVTARTQPHFLANALNTIAATVKDDPERAEDLIEKLGGLFSHAVGGSSGARVTVADELDAARGYLVVQTARFGDRLQFSFSGTALSLDDAVPAMCVVPLVENAVLHGLSVPGKALTIAVRAELDGDDLQVEVEDDGPGPDGTRHEGHGTGLRDLEERLDLVYGPGRARVALERSGGRTRARLTVPREVRG